MRSPKARRGAPKRLPKKWVVPRRIDVSRVSAERILEHLGDPRPSPALRKLMSRRIR